jgi:hypothetical protein
MKRQTAPVINDFRYKDANQFYLDYDQILIDALDVFRWDGLPTPLTSHKLEHDMLLEGTRALFVANEGVFLLPYAVISYDIYQQVDEIRPIIPNSRFQLTNPISNPRWILWDNPSKKPIHNKIIGYVTAINETYKSIRILTKKLRIPWVAAVSESEKATYQAFFEKLEEGYPFIPVKTDFDISRLDIMAVPNISEALEDLWSTLFKIRNELFNLIGIVYNASNGKNEQLIVAEVATEMTNIFTLSNARYYMRKTWSERVFEDLGILIMPTMTNAIQNDLINNAQAQGTVEEQGGEGKNMSGGNGI